MKVTTRSTFILAMTLVAGSSFAGTFDPTFISLGPASAKAASSYTHGLSDNGSTVIGSSNLPSLTLGLTSLQVGYRWSADSGMVRLELSGLGTKPADANGISGDGKTIVGGDSYGRPYRWSPAGGLQLLPLPPAAVSGAAKDASDDGSTIVGQTSLLGTGLLPRAFRYTAAEGSTYITDAAQTSVANAVSGNGLTAVGRYGNQAFRWTKEKGVTLLGDLPGLAVDSEATGVSADGSIVVGRGVSGSGPEAFRWTAAGGMVGLGDLPGGLYASQALGVSPDGRIIVGASAVAAGDRAMIWDNVNGMRELQQVLVAQGLGPALTGWTLLQATGVTVAPNGMTVVTGFGKGPDGNIQSFLAKIPLVANFSTLGALPGGNFVSSSRAISADGATIVGVSGSVTGDRAFVWNNERGMYDIGVGALSAAGVSGDGKVVVGFSNSNDAIRWTLAGASHFGAGSVAKVISSDGSTTAGCCDQPNATAAHLKRVPMSWGPGGTVTYTTVVNGARTAAVVTSISKNGSVLVGNALPTPGATTISRAYLWKPDGTGFVIPALAGGNGESEATGVSEDGTAVVGWMRSANGPVAFRWTAATGTVSLGNISGGNASLALGISPDGTTVVGISAVNGQNRAFLWDAAGGMRDLSNFLATRGLADKIKGWYLYTAAGVTVSTNGVVVLTGAAKDPENRTQSFIVTLPTLLATPAKP